MLKLATLFSIVAVALAIEAIINPSSSEALDAALQKKIDEIANNLGELVVLLNQDVSGSLFYQPNSQLAATSSALDTLLYDLDNVEEGEGENDGDVKVEIIEITEVDPEEDVYVEEEAEEVDEVVEGDADNEIEGRANSTIHDSRNRMASKGKSHGKAKTKLSSGKGSKKSKLVKHQLSAGKGKSKKQKLSGGKTKKIVKKTTLSGNKRASSKGKIKLSAKQTRQAMSNLNSKEVRNICDTFAGKTGLKTKSAGGNLRGLGEEPAKPTIAMTLQQLTEAFNKLQSAIVTVNKGAPAPSPSTSSSTDLGPSAGNGDLSTISPQVASNIASVLHRMAAVTASTTSNPLDPIVKAAISVQGQAANALRGILPSGQRV